MMKLDNSVVATAAKKFVLNPNKNNGLVLATVESVTVDTVDYDDTSKVLSFKNQSVPRISFKFVSYGDPAGVKPSYQWWSANAIDHTAQNVVGDMQWKGERIAKYIKHFHQEMSGRPDFTPEELALLAFPLEETENNDGVTFKEQPVEAVLEAWGKFFTNVASIFNGLQSGVPLFKTKEGKAQPYWLKLLLYETYKGKLQPVANGDPGFPNFLSDSVIEKFVDGVAPSLRIRIEKGEWIIPKAAAELEGNKKAAPVQGAAVNVTASDLPDWMSGGAAPSAF